MVSKHLSKDLVSLIHYVELNQAGWWERALEQIVTATMWLSDASEIRTIAQVLYDEFSIEVDTTKVSECVDALCAKGVLLETGPAVYKVSERSVRELQKSLDASNENSLAAKEHFIGCLEKHSIPFTEDKWALFNDRCLQPLVRELGARTYELLFGGRYEAHVLDQYESFAAFAKGCGDPHPQEFRNAISMFWDSSNPVVKDYILRLLDAHFVLEASHLRASALEGITAVGNPSPSFTIFVDTNFLFSILGLHDNPANDSANTLLHLAESLSGRVELRFYVVLDTLRETRHTLEGYLKSAKGLHVPPTVAGIATQSGTSGIIRRYLEAVSQSRQTVGIDEYLDPYIKNLTTIVKSKNIDIYQDASINSYATKEAVINDILSQQDYEAKFWGDRAKTYEKLRHDIVLWHFAKDKRPVGDEAINARYWVVTIDNRLLRFDAHKRQGTTAIPVCIHPATLIQLLHFWIPRGPELEEAAYASILPFFLNGFDQQSEVVTLKILKTLSRYENLGDLPEETIANILINESLTAKLSKDVDDDQQQQEFVREALIEENLRLEKERQQVQDALEDERAQKIWLQHVETELHAERKRYRTDVELLKSASSELAAGLGDRIRTLEEALDKHEEGEHRRHAWRIYVRKALISLAAVVLATWVVTAILTLIDNRCGVFSPLVYSAFVLAWVFSMKCLANKEKAIRNTLVHRLFTRGWVVLSFLVVTIVGIVISELFKRSQMWAAIKDVFS